MAKIYQFEELLEARRRKDYEAIRHEPITTTFAEIEEMTTEMVYSFLSSYLGMTDKELTECLTEVEDIAENEKLNT